MAYKNIEDKRKYDNAYRERNREILREKAKERRLGLKLKVLEYYGNSCKHCGFNDIRALCIDHINDNGAEERKALDKGNRNFSGWRFYEYLVKNNYPKGYQTLCANCNMIKELKDKF